MLEHRCTNDYLPWLLAHDFNFAPFESLKSELDVLDDNEVMVLLASREEQTNALFIYNQAW